MPEVTVGIDIGTTSVKAVAADGDGRVVARARVPHRVVVPAPDRLEHDAAQAWRRGVRRAFREVGRDLDVAGVSVAAMVPSLCAVGRGGRPTTPGLLYGDARGRDGAMVGANPAESGELVGFLRWCAAEAPGAAGYWPAQGVANAALGGEGVIDFVTAMTAMPLFTGSEWDPEVAAGAGAVVERLPRVAAGDGAVGRVDGVPLGPGTIDAYAEQLVAGADGDGDVLVILGATLITWAVVPEWREVPGLWTVPHTAPGKTLVGGPSNAGGLFLNWALGLAGRGGSEPEPGRVPVWTPYVRGERTPLHDPDRRAGVHDLDLLHGPAALRRAAWEASGFVVRHHLDLAGLAPRRIVATGGGVRVEGWVRAMADATGLPVDVVAVPEGGALGAAYLARVAAGLEPSSADAGRWARVDRRVEPDGRWKGPTAERYARFRELAEAPLT
jgi:xylulokinase